MEYDVGVVGAGVAGLTCAFILAKAGKRVLLLEKQPVCGGYATTFKRGGFVFESAVHCVDGLGVDGHIRKFLEDNQLDSQVEFIALKDFARIRYPEHDFVANFSRDNFLDFLKKEFPAQKKGIERLFSAIDRFYRQFDRFWESGLPERLKYILFPLLYPSILKSFGLTAEEFIKKYISDHRLKAIITDIWRFAGLPETRLSAFYFLLIFRGYYYEPSACLKGGLMRLFEAMVSEIRCSGSEVRFNTSVEKILTDRHHAVRAVVSDKKEEFKVKAVVSNANAIDTLTKMPDSQEVREWYRKELSGFEISPSAFQVYLGLKVPAKKLGMGHFLFSINKSYSHDEDFNFVLRGDYDSCSIELVDHAQIDPGLVPQGKGSLLIMIFDSFSRWENLDPESYRLKKEEVAKKLILRAQEFLPGLSDNIEVMEVATPRTMQRFSQSPEGAIYGFAQTPQQAGINRLAQKTRIKGLFLAGAWTAPGAGVHACFISGMEAAELAKKYLKKKRG